MLMTMWTYTRLIHFRNNNNTIWRGSVLTGEEPPPHSGELKHALQLSRLLSSRHHISTEHRLRRKHLLLHPYTNARKEKEEKKRKRSKEQGGKKGGKKEEKKGRKTKEKRPQRGTSRDGPKTCFFFLEREIVTKLTPQKNRF